MIKKRFVPLLLVGTLLVGCTDEDGNVPGSKALSDKWEDLMDELKEMDEESMKKNWKRYYSKAIADLKRRVKELKKKEIEYETQLTLQERRLNTTKKQAQRAKKLIKKNVDEYKAQNAKDPDGTYLITTKTDGTRRKFKKSQARSVLQTRAREYKREFSKKRLDHRITLVQSYQDLINRTRLTISQYKDKIRDLEDQMELYETQLEVVELRKSLNGLCEAGRELEEIDGGEDPVPSFDELKKINKSLDEAIAKSDAKEKIKKRDELENEITSLKDAVKDTGSDLDGLDDDPVLAEVASLD